ncbi:proclotting enzyme-like [Hyalella azteca]|uniref:Proclotting enzyme-like n=1 Tax=Hyalella azteca TaxID=294128 RepID=A0A8B7N400_HYAAZ|nr:proclotting enzyme-like [Hyalella azteca]
MLPGLLFLGLACLGLPACEAQRPVVFGGTAPPGCRCVPLTDCPELRPPAGQRLSYDQAAALQRLKCGFLNRTIKVCCGGGQPSPLEDDPTPPPENVGTEGAPPTDLPLTCGDTNSIDRIFGGRNAPLGGNPWMVALGYSVPGQGGQLELSYECGATLVTRQHVVTAAHCVRPDDLGFRSLSVFHS